MTLVRVPKNMVDDSKSSPLILGVNKSISQSDNDSFIVVGVTGLTITLPLSTTLRAGFRFSVYARDYSVIIAPNAADKIQNGTTGASVTLSKGVSSTFVSDGVSGWHQFNSYDPAGTAKSKATAMALIFGG